MGPPIKTILFVSGFSASLRARDLAYEFERYGKLIRCDIPALKSQNSSPYAFIEYRSEAAAEDAFYDMHGRSIDGRRLTVQWAKNTPSSAWRYGDDERSGGRESRSAPPPRRDEPRRRSRSRSPERGSTSGRRERSPEPAARREGSSRRSPEPAGAERRRRSPEPVRERQRERSPVRERERSPVRQRERSPVRERERSPVRERERERSPVGQRERARSPIRATEDADEGRRAREESRDD